LVNEAKPLASAGYLIKKGFELSSGSINQVGLDLIPGLGLKPNKPNMWLG